jgi:hypothetical protein
MKHPVWTGIVLFFALIFLLSLFYENTPNETDTFNSENYSAPPLYEKPRNINLTFYDKNTTCSLNGEIYVDELFLGMTEEGKYLLTKEEYDEKFQINSLLFIQGETENCFGKDSNLPLAMGWETPDLNYYFDTGEEVLFEAEINPRQPAYFSAMQGFIRPEEIDLESFHLTTNLSSTQAVEELFSKFYMSYISDSAFFGETEYWQTPKDLLKNRAGDCEDWAITMISIIEAYNSSIDCYLAGWDTHMNMICNFNNKTMGMFDQDKISTFNSIEKNSNLDATITQENKISVREWIGNYFENYGLNPNERTLYHLINSKEIILFESKEDFVNWVVEKEGII